MSVQNREATDVQPADPAFSPEADRPVHRRRAVVNWILALLTVPAAALVMVFAVGAAMSVAACSAAQCPHLGPSGLLYGVLFYGAPVVAVLTLVASFFTAKRRRGFVVPLIGLALLVADLAITALVF
ncbi:hypothetical protein A5725_23480 [Mycobacterium kubicae]|uniref:hypothetical protein n=1 Tax=Mycobacterium kubicae TaxID=120959 RepID=UPI000800F5CC|nr:hypothetical protein [Mycobacterium kubicae]OBF17344.1 hypothetical protein A5725_23480 [Mycobacterium kubicae]